MNINSLITEWTYRLTKGYPDSESDYQELDRVLNEMTDLQREYIDNNYKNEPISMMIPNVNLTYLERLYSDGSSN